MEIRQAVILVGGRGERLMPLTDTVPKPMVPVLGKPFLERLVILLRDNGIRKFLFLAGYLGEKIEAYFGNGEKWGISIKYSFEKEPLGTGGALRLAQDKLDGRFFLLFGDSYLPGNYAAMFDSTVKSKRKVVLAVYDNAEDTGVPFNVKLDKISGLVAEYNKRKDNPADFDHCDAGVIVVEKSVVEMIPDNKKVSFEESIYPALIQQKELGYYICGQRFYDIGTNERLKVFEAYIAKEKRK